MTRADVISVLASAKRQGEKVDQPEGARYIQISDTLARRMIEALEGEGAVQVERRGKARRVLGPSRELRARG